MSGTTNFLQFNPSQANQETDAAYLADATRTGGALDGNGWPDVSANKTLYQVSTMTAALAQMLANKGFSVSDANYSALVSQLANILTTADGRGGLQNLSWSSSITLNAASFEGFAIPLQGATTLSLSGVSAGALYVALYTQDATGGRVVTFGSGFGAGAVQPDPAPYATSTQIFIANATLQLVPVGPLISSGGINNTPIGNSAPSSAVFTTLTLAAGAPLGQVLTGDGSKYVPQSAPGYTYGSNSNGYWEKAPSGVIRQWGSGNTVGSASPQAFSFPTPFSDTNYTVQVTCTYMQSHLINGAPLSNAQFQTYSWNMSNDRVPVPFTWMAVGY